jgi:hypothetical protein
LIAADAAGALELITSSEAALPAEQVTGRERGITRAPNVVIVSPSRAAGTLKSPLSLKIRFESYGGAEIDVDSVLLTYLKKPAVDLTQRRSSTPAGSMSKMPKSLQARTRFVSAFRTGRAIELA